MKIEINSEKESLKGMDAVDKLDELVLTVRRMDYEIRGLHGEVQSKNLGYFALVSLTGIIAVGSALMGPIDSARTVYNALIGDTPALKSNLLNYTRVGISHQKHLTQNQVDLYLAQELNYSFSEGEKKINPQHVSIEKLWDASEDYAWNFRQKWVWPSL